MLRRLRSVLALLALALIASACRVDVEVEVTMEADGSGTITIVATADADVVDSAPGLAQDLRFDDVEEAGWEVTGPRVTDDEGITVELVHSFSTPAEATALLASLNGADGPFQGVTLTRTEADETVAFAVAGIGRVNSGVLAFTDPELFQAIGATPYADEIAAAGINPTQAVGITLRLELPGSVEESSADPESGGLEWVVPLDGTTVELSATSTLSLADDAAWSAVATVFLVVLIAWVVASAVLIALVVRARNRRRRRRAVVTPPA